ncbi:DNA primase [Sulfurospirillum sp. 1307]
MIDNNSIENLKTRLDIVDVVGSYLELKKSGANFKCVCPFHDDSNPSLVISPSKQIYHCFSCGAGGDSIKFVMEYEKLSYPEAIEKLANMYNFSLTYTSQNGKKQEDRKLLENLNNFYKKNLDNNTFAKEYLTKRGIGEASIEKFEIGYAPSSRETLSFLGSHGYSVSEAIELGILGSGEGGTYARFIERIMFPIKSASGKIVGFGGRTINNHPAKYINSPQTKLFNKSYLLYGYNFAKENIFKQNNIIITEGYLDVIMLHQAGFQTAVATLGTALTKEHLPLITKTNPRVILAYDGDSAGIAAALKASLMLSKMSVDGGVVIFGAGADPADMVKNGQIEELNRLFNKPTAFVEFVITHIIKKYNIKNPIEKQKALEETSAYLKTLPATINEEYTGIVAAKLNISQNLIKVQTHNSSRLQNNKRVFEDILELTIIKTLLTKPSLIDTLLDTINPKMFKTHQIELDALLKNQKDHPKLREILLRDDIKVYGESEFTASMLNFLINFYNEEFKRVKNSDMDYDKKSFMIRKIQENIFHLKQGRLVNY